MFFNSEVDKLINDLCVLIAALTTTTILQSLPSRGVDPDRQCRSILRTEQRLQSDRYQPSCDLHLRRTDRLEFDFSVASVANFDPRSQLNRGDVPL